MHWTEDQQLTEDWHAGLLGPGAMFELVPDAVFGTMLPVFASRPRSLVEVLERATGHGERTFATSATATIAYADLVDAVATAAAQLIEAHGVAPGDRVAVAGTVSLEHLVGLLAVVSAGAIAVTMNPAWTDAETNHALALTTPVLLLTDRVPPRPGQAPQLGAPPVVPLADIAVRPAPGQPIPSLPAVRIDEDDPFAIVFTSGTTGRPKGAVLTHRNAIHFALAAATTSAVHSIVHALPSGGDGIPTVIASAPLFHVSGLLGQLVNSLMWGTGIVIPPPGRWRAETHLELTQRHRVTSWSLVPTQLTRLLDHPAFASFDLSSLQMIGGGGASFAPHLLRRTEAALPHVSMTVRIGYGMTETAGTVSMLQPPVRADRHASVGPPVAGTEIEIRDATGTPIPDGDVGQIWVRGAQVFAGYWQDPAATRACLDEHRWYATGDFGRSDGEYLFLESRLRDLIIRGGENIYPIEIENRLIEHPAIVAAAVVGVPDDDLGQVVKAVIVVEAGHRLTEAEVQAWVGDALARYKVPAVVQTLDSLPMTDNGKVMKHLLH